MTVGTIKPTIGITTGTGQCWEPEGRFYLSYKQSIEQAEGKPVALGPKRCGRLEDCDGVLVTGGPDIHPCHYDRRPEDKALSPDKLKEKYSISWDEVRDAYELPLVEKALESASRSLPSAEAFRW